LYVGKLEQTPQALTTERKRGSSWRNSHILLGKKHLSTP
jgi:hypothetical protein